MVTARIKEGVVELHSMHCSAQVLEEGRGEEGLLNPKAHCSKCTLECECADSIGTIVCKKCLSKRVLFIKMFDYWPIKPFTELSVENQIAVWQADNTQVALNDALVDALSTQRINQELCEEGGSYLPVSVYEKMGYETDTLETTCPKKWDVELKEWTYKKTVTTESKRDITKNVTEEIKNLRASEIRKKLCDYNANPRKKRKRSESSSSTSSKSSNDSNASVDSPKTAKAKLAKQAKAMAADAKIDKAIAAEESKAARIRAVNEAKAQKVQEAADAKQAAKDPILISMHMHRDILVL